MGNKKVGSSTREVSENTCMQETSEVKSENAIDDAKIEIGSGNDNETMNLSKDAVMDDQPSQEDDSEANAKDLSMAKSSGGTSIEKPQHSDSASEEPPVTVPQENDAVDNQEPSTEIQEDLRVDDEEEDEGPWELKKILSVQELTNSYPIKCSTLGCVLPAGVVYSSVSNTKCIYYYCLDCQVSSTRCPRIGSTSQTAVCSFCRRTILKDGLRSTSFR